MKISKVQTIPLKFKGNAIIRTNELKGLTDIINGYEKKQSPKSDLYCFKAADGVIISGGDGYMLGLLDYLTKASVLPINAIDKVINRNDYDSADRVIQANDEHLHQLVEDVEKELKDQLRKK